MNHFRIAIASAALMSFCGTALGLPQIGEHAPAIRVSHIVSPATHSLSLPAFAGKTVVIDFWATWCGPCVASMPHLNEVEAALDPNKFVFLALDDESEDVVRRFLEKRKISSIVALDQNHTTFSAFGVTSRPATIVIDPKGIVALVTEPMHITPRVLLAISRGETTWPLASDPVKAHSIVKPLSSRSVAPRNIDRSLAGVMLQKMLPTEMAYSFNHDSQGKQTFIGFDAKSLVGIALAAPDRRVKYLNDMPSGSYDLTINLGKMDEATKSAILTAIVRKAFNLDIRRSDSVEDVLLLKRTARIPLNLQQTFDPSSAHGSQHNGSAWAFSNLTMSDFASEVEDKYGVTVVDDTGLSGGFDGVIHWPQSKDRLNDVIQHDLGLELIPAKRSVPMFTVAQRN